MAGHGFGGRVFQARKALEQRLGRTVPQTEIASMLDVHGVTVGSWEKGAKEPNLATVVKLARVLGVDPGWLAFGSGPVTQEKPAILPNEGTIVPRNPAVPLPAESVVPRPTGMHPLEKETPSGFPPIPSHPIRPRKDTRNRKDGSG